MSVSAPLLWWCTWAWRNHGATHTHASNTSHTPTLCLPLLSHHPNLSSHSRAPHGHTLERMKRKSSFMSSPFCCLLPGSSQPTHCVTPARIRRAVQGSSNQAIEQSYAEVNGDVNESFLLAAAGGVVLSPSIVIIVSQLPSAASIPVSCSIFLCVCSFRAIRAAKVS